MNTRIWINKRFVDIDKAKISVFDRSFLYGDGVFETMRSYQGAVFKLNEHLNRLFASLKIIRIKTPYSKAQIRNAVYKTLKANKLKDAYIRVAITRGEGRFGISYKDRLVPNVIIVAKRFGGYPGWMYSRGIRANVSKIRQNEHSPLSRIKSSNFLHYILARSYAKEKGYDEAILMNTAGFLACAATSNIFLVKNNMVITPGLDSGVLAGITRGVIIKIAGGTKFRVMEKTVSYRELVNADEVFLTNSLAEVIPVVKIDSGKIGTGMPGRVTRLLHLAFKNVSSRSSL